MRISGPKVGQNCPKLTKNAHFWPIFSEKCPKLTKNAGKLPKIARKCSNFCQNLQKMTNKNAHWSLKGAPWRSLEPPVGTLGAHSCPAGPFRCFFTCLHAFKKHKNSPKQPRKDQNSPKQPEMSRNLHILSKISVPY